MTDYDTRHVPSLTSRPTVDALERIINAPFPCLDHGFVRLIDYMGDDGAIVQAARVSYGRGTRTPSEDAALIRYLMRHRHTTPFEMCEIKFHVKLPIFVARQFIRHRTASVNEYSARYSILDREFYVPAPEDLAAQSLTNRQGRGDVLSPEQAEGVRALLIADAGTAYDHYEWMLNDDGTGASADPSRDGVARELARMNLSLNFYTQWYWKTDLHNLLHFLGLRRDAHAQKEIRVYADAMGEIARAWCPVAYEAWDDCVFGGVRLTRQQWRMLLSFMEPGTAELMESVSATSIPAREKAELIELMRRP